MFSVKKILVTGLVVTGIGAGAYAIYKLRHKAKNEETDETTTDADIADARNTLTEILSAVRKKKEESPQVEEPVKPVNQKVISTEEQYLAIMKEHEVRLTKMYTDNLIPFEQIAIELGRLAKETVGMITSSIDYDPSSIKEDNHDSTSNQTHSIYPDVDELVQQVIENAGNIDIPVRKYSVVRSPKLVKTKKE